jgi:hypothetical protein
VAVAKSAIAVSSIVGEAAIVGVCGASIFRLHPANANTENANPIQNSHCSFISRFYWIFDARRVRGGYPANDHHTQSGFTYFLRRHSANKNF